MHAIKKYDRTPHLSGSKLQHDDTSDGQIHVSQLPDGTCIWEEKLDGGNCAFSFSDDAELILQSRGHSLNGGPREGQFSQFKAWANALMGDLFDRIGNRYIVYGENMQAKHTVYYDLLPSLFMEFDIWDREQGIWLDTPVRYRLLDGLPITPVPVVHVGRIKTTTEVRALILPSLYKSPDWKDNLLQAAARVGVSEEQVLRETDPSDLAEGLYLKIERDGRVIGRYKFIRPDFLQTIMDSGSHWADRIQIPNRLAPLT